MVNNIEEFVAYIPTAAGSEWSTISPFVKLAQNEITGSLTGDDLFTKVETLAANNKVREMLTQLVCLKAYNQAIPFSDVVQSPNGFAVVSNSNLTPASKERVERLILWCEKQIDTLTDLFINVAIATPDLLTEWKKFDFFNDLTNCLFLTGIDMSSLYVTNQMPRKTFESVKYKFLVWQEEVLAPVISKVFLDEIISHIRDNALTAAEKEIVSYGKMVLCSLLSADQLKVDKLLNYISTKLDNDLVTYATYAASAEYALKTSAPYANDASHPTFFFGV